MRAFTYLTPGNPAEAVRMLVENAPDARVIAGGQNLLLGMKDRSDSPPVLVSLGAVPELRGIRTTEAGELVVGAATTYATMARTVFDGWQAEISAVCGNLADRPVRTMGTVGGAACSADSRYDVPALVTGVGARLDILSPEGLRTLGAADFFLPDGGTSMRPDDLLVAIRFPARDAFTAVAFEKFRHRVFDAALASATCALRTSDGAIAELRITIGATTPRPTLCVASTDELIGEAVEALDVRLLSDSVAIEVLGPESTSDSRQLRYQRELVRAVARQALTRVTTTPRS